MTLGLDRGDGALNKEQVATESERLLRGPEVTALKAVATNTSSTQTLYRCSCGEVACVIDVS